MLTTTRARVSAWTKALFQNTVFKLSQELSNQTTHLVSPFGGT